MLLKSKKLLRVYGSHNGITTNQNSSHVRRSENDLYETPEIATQSLCYQINLTQPVWEPACGRGAISSVLINKGYKVIASDLYDYGYGKFGIDFIKRNIKIRIGDIVTNPPFDRALEFCQRAVEIQKGTGNRAIMLLRLDFLATKSRKNFLENSPFEKLLVFSLRVKFKTPNSAKPIGGVNYAWFIWKDGYKGKPVIEWL